MSNRLWRVLGALVLALFLASLVWSVLFETVLPLIQAERWTELALNVAGIPLIFAGTGVFIWGGWLVLRGVFDAETGWRPGLAHLGLGMLLIALGGFLINLTP